MASSQAQNEQQSNVQLIPCFNTVASILARSVQHSLESTHVLSRPMALAPAPALALALKLSMLMDSGGLYSGVISEQTVTLRK